MSDNNHVVMVVEDEVVLRDVYVLVLKTKGYDVIAAENGRDALQKLTTHQPRVILLDIHMPIMDGREFMRTVNLLDYPNTRVIVNSNLSDNNVEAEMSELGAYKIVLKSSMSPMDLVKLVQNTIDEA